MDQDTLIADVTPGTALIGDRRYMIDPKGAYVPVERVKPQHKLEDEVVRKVVGYAEPLSDEISRFRQHTFDDVDAFMALMEQQYRARGGQKGNLTLTSYDGLLRVQVAHADQISFGAELQVAKSLIEECIGEWAADSRDELRVLVNGAFDVDQAGNINRGRLLTLSRYAIDDERWVRAMEAIRESIKVVGSKRYVNMYRRPTAQAPWQRVTLDLAAS